MNQPTAARLPDASNPQGILWAVLAIGIFAFIFLAGKFSGGAATATQIMWMRYAGGFLTVCIIAAVMRTSPRDLATSQLRFHALRAAMGSGGGTAAIYAAAHMPVANATAIGLLDAVFVMALGVYWLNEVVSARQLIAAGACLAGALIVVLFGSGVRLGEATLEATAAALAGAGFLAIETILIKKLARSENPLAFLLYVNLFGTLLLAIPGFIQWKPIPASYVAAFLALGPLAIAGQACNIMAYRRADVSVLGPIKYTWLVFAALFGWLFFAEVPSLATYAGGALIAAGGIMLAMSRTPAHVTAHGRKTP